MLLRIAPVIEQAHGKHRVKTFHVLRQIFHPQVQVLPLRILDVLLQRIELHDEEQGGVDPEHKIGAGPAHAPAVVPAATTDIQHRTSAQRGDVIPESIPLPVRTPFGIDVQTKQFERAFAPGMQ